MVPAEISLSIDFMEKGKQICLMKITTAKQEILLPGWNR